MSHEDILQSEIQESQSNSAIKAKTLDILEQAEDIKLRLGTEAAKKEYDELRLATIGALRDLRMQTASDLEGIKQSLSQNHDIAQLSNGSISEEELTHITTQFEELKSLNSEEDASKNVIKTQEEKSTDRRGENDYLKNLSISEIETPEEKIALLKSLPGLISMLPEEREETVNENSTKLSEIKTKNGVKTFGKLLTEEIIGNDEGWNEKYIRGVNSEEGWFILEIDDFEKNYLQNSERQILSDDSDKQMNSALLANYLKYLRKSTTDVESFKNSVLESFGGEKTSQVIGLFQDENQSNARKILENTGFGDIVTAFQEDFKNFSFSSRDDFNEKYANYGKTEKQKFIATLGFQDRKNLFLIGNEEAYKVMKSKPEFIKLRNVIRIELSHTEIGKIEQSQEAEKIIVELIQALDTGLDLTQFITRTETLFPNNTEIKTQIFEIKRLYISEENNPDAVIAKEMEEIFPDILPKIIENDAERDALKTRKAKRLDEIQGVSSEAQAERLNLEIKKIDSLLETYGTGEVFELETQKKLYNATPEFEKKSIAKGDKTFGELVSRSPDLQNLISEYDKQKNTWYAAQGIDKKQDTLREMGITHEAESVSEGSNFSNVASIVATENGVEIQTLSGVKIPITPEEQKIAERSPEALQNMVDFYMFFKDLNLESVWEHRSDLIKFMKNNGVAINLDDNSIDSTELIAFGNEFIKILNGFLPPGEELHEKQASIFSLRAELKRFSQSGNIMSQHKDFNTIGEDRFGTLMRKYGIIGGVVFEAEKLAQVMREEEEFSDEKIEK